MSLNQSKSEKSDLQYRKSGGGGRSGSSGQQRSFVGGGGGGVSAAPSLSTNPSSLSNSRSFKKTHNAQGVQSRASAGSVNAPESNAAPAVRPAVQNDAHSQPMLHAPAAAASAKPNDTCTQRSTRPIPRAPPSQLPAVTSDSARPTVPAKGDGTKGFALQFGSISPGVMNGMQVPARTTSAPPNLDEQKRAQAYQDALRRAAAMPVPSAPKPEITKKDVAPVPQHPTGEGNADSKVKRDTAAISASSSPSQAQRAAVLPVGGISMPMPYPQPPVSLQFGGPNPQIQSQGMPATSLPMPMQMPLQMGHPSQVQQQVFMSRHLMQAPGILHQSQGLGFNPQMGQLPHQLNSLGMNMSPQYSPQQPAKFVSTRKAVKITHPETHEELRLDKRNDVYTDGISVSRPHHNVAPQSQNVPTYTSSHPIGYYSNSYVGDPTFFSPSTSLPLTSAQATPVSQASRFSYPVSQAPHAMPFMNQPASNSLSMNKGRTAADGFMKSSNLDSAREVQNVVSSAPVSVTAKVGTSSTEKHIEAKPLEKGEVSKISGPVVQISSSHLQKGSQETADNCLPQSKPGFEQPKPTVSVTGENVAEETASSTSAASAVITDGKKRETVARSDSFKEHQKKPVKKGHAQLPHQVGSQSSSHLPPQAVEVGDSLKKASSEPVEAKKDLGEPGAGQDAVESSNKLSRINGAAPDDVDHSGADVVLESHACNSSEVVETGNRMDSSLDHCSGQEPPNDETSGAKEHGEEKDFDGSKSQRSAVVDVDSLKLAKADDKNEENTDVKGNNHATGPVDASGRGMQATTSRGVGDQMPLETSFSGKHSSAVSDDRNIITVDASSKRQDSMSGDDSVTKSHSLGIATAEEGMETARLSSSGSLSSSNKPSFESNKAKSTLARGKKKIKQILQKADAQGTTSDLYNAYKGPEEKKECTISTETESASTSDLKLASAESIHEGASLKEKDVQSKAEPEDWEDAADISTPKSESVSKREHESLGQDVEEAGTAKKYSRDFLLTFSDQCTNLPEGFEITSDIANILMRPNSSSARVIDHQYPSPGRIVDRPSVGPRVDRRGSGMMDADRWNKLQGPFPSPRDMGLDPGYGPMSMGFRPGQGGNYGVLRNPRAHPPVQHPILSVPMQSVQRTDTDRWRNTNFKGLMPSPQTPMQAMHKAERKYEVGKVTDEEEAKQRKLKGILNKLTPENFDKLFAQVKEVNIDNVVTLNGVISQLFDKALMEPTFCEMYSNFCYELSLVLPELSVDDEKITFKRLLLNNCQEEFERGEREEEEANKADTEDEKLSAEEKEERRVKARRRMLGNIRLIGELYKRRMLTERIMHECIMKLLGQYPDSVEEDIESLCKLMSTIGEMIDHPRAKQHIDVYFDMMENLSNNMKLSSRVRFMLKDSIDLRKNKWQQRRKVEGPKKIQEVHRDAAQERQGQATRPNRGPSMSASMRRGQPVDFGPRGSSMLSSPVGQMGSFRGLPSQDRSFGMQDVRVEERNSFDNRSTVSVPLPQRSLGDDTITLGPQGGLARGMSIRGQPSVPSTHLVDVSLSHGGTRTTGGLNGFSSVSESFGGSESSTRDLGANPANRDHKNVGHIMGRSIPASAPRREEVSSAQNISSEKVWPEERLREMSSTAIKEFYSAKDEKEVDLCVRELNAPTFYPSVISIWVTDSFERKDIEREMLNKLIVNLSKPWDGRLFMPDQLIKGFESVLSNLDDTVNDAPKAPDFLGRLFARVIMENVVSLKDIGGLLYEGGEKPGRLRELGLAGDVLGSILENIKSEKGEKAVKDMCSSCNLRLEDFRPPYPLKSRKLELFV